jgi:hypothetical protein
MPASVFETAKLARRGPSFRAVRTAEHDDESQSVEVGRERSPASSPGSSPTKSESAEGCARHPARLGRFCVKEITSVAAVAALALAVAALVRNDARWIDAEVTCAGRSCDECARASHCAWCGDPELAGTNASHVMPGFCERVDHKGASSCSAGLGSAACAAEDALEDQWATCSGRASSAAACSATVAADCQWCEVTTLQQNGLVFEFSLRLSRARLGKSAFLYINGSKRPFCLSWAVLTTCG